MSRLAARDIAVVPPGAGAPVLRGFDLEVGPGEWVAVGGPNGGGKTSLLLALAGLWPIASGTLAFEGEPFGPGIGRGEVAAVLQDPSSQILQPSLREELALGARHLGLPAGEVGRRVAEWAGRLGLDRELDLDPATLSAGRQQLALIAAALVTRPRLLCADEPTAHLDPDARRRVLEAVRAEVSRGLSVVWVTQDFGEAAAADRRVEIGEVGQAGGAGRPAGTRPTPGEVVLDVRIAPPATDGGPRVATSRTLAFAIRRGEPAAIEGPNGAGKSVVLAAVAGLEPNPQVEVVWRPPAGPPPIVALQYPELQIFEEIVADELAFAAVARGLARVEALARASEHLDALGLDPVPFLRRRTWTLSTGEKRLVETVAALVAPAGLVLLDEPTAGLDHERRSRLGQLVRDRASRDAILIASQDRNWIADLEAKTARLG